MELNDREYRALIVDLCTELGTIAKGGSHSPGFLYIDPAARRLVTILDAAIAHGLKTT